MTGKKHLTHEEIAICADAINENQYDKLPGEFRTHIKNCNDCASEVLMVTDIAYNYNFTQAKKKEPLY